MRILGGTLPGIIVLVVLVLRSGYPLGQGTLTRMYSLHTFILPAISLILMLLHLAMLRKQGISGPQ